MKTGDKFELGDIKDSKGVAIGQGATVGINEAVRAPRIPQMAPPKPLHFVQRPGEYDELVRLLTSSAGDENVAITAALRGAGGYGKTTLAQALYQDP